jgi:hypothetical protein
VAELGKTAASDLPVRNWTFSTLINPPEEGNILHYTTGGRKTHRAFAPTERPSGREAPMLKPPSTSKVAVNLLLSNSLEHNASRPPVSAPR